jgi:pimeloyl-ACP methyl ester carboxylesterase
MEATATFRSEILDVPGGSVYYETRGAGPVLLCMPGGPADATTFRKIENDLGRDRTVVTYDPRGLSHSSPFDPQEDDRMVEIFAEDACRILEAVGGAKASILASSGGAVIALELIKRHADLLDTVVVHEPPSPDLLDDQAGTRAAMEDVCDTCARDGMFPAMQKFMDLIGIHGGPSQPQGEPTPEQLEAMALMQRNMSFFFSRYIRNIARYRIDVQALRSASCRIVPAIGADSAGQLAHRSGLGLGRLLGVEPAVFPGDHGGFDGRPEEFAARLREVLES